MFLKNYQKISISNLKSKLNQPRNVNRPIVVDFGLK